MPGVNEPDQHHANRFCLIKDFWLPMRYPNGAETGDGISAFQLVYNDGSPTGYARFDHHEWVYAKVGGVNSRMLFHRGGLGYGRNFDEGFNAPYGHVLLSDLKSSPGQPVPSGDGRGGAAPSDGLYRLRITEMPATMLYKARAVGSMWRTYGDLGRRNGGPHSYTPLLWSWLYNSRGLINGGGGMVRAVLPPNCPVRLTTVPKIKSPSYSISGLRNGTVWAAFVKAMGLYGWLSWGHDEGGGFVPHVVRV